MLRHAKPELDAFLRGLLREKVILPPLNWSIIRIQR